jgi:hypothetical protein
MLMKYPDPDIESAQVRSFHSHFSVLKSQTQPSMKQIEEELEELSPHSLAAKTFIRVRIYQN